MNTQPIKNEYIMCILSRFDNEEDTSKRYDFLQQIFNSFEKDIKPVQGATWPTGAPGKDAPKRPIILLVLIITFFMIWLKQEFNNMSKEAMQTRVLLMQWQNNPCEWRIEKIRQFYSDQLNAQSIQQPELPMIPDTTEVIEETL